MLEKRIHRDRWTHTSQTQIHKHVYYTNLKVESFMYNLIMEVIYSNTDILLYYISHMYVFLYRIHKITLRKKEGVTQ